jgi:hypothetical protein
LKQYDIDHDAHVVTVVYSGVVTDSDLRTGINEYGRLGSNYTVLVDLTTVERIDASAEALRELARVASGRRARKRCAVIAPTPVTFGMARMYQVFCLNETGDSEVGVFSDAAAARMWMGLSE